jgi:hypothetical protein
MTETKKTYRKPALSKSSVSLQAVTALNGPSNVKTID